jgi:hypothetical protein
MVVRHMFLSSLGILSVDSIPSARTNLFNDLPRKSPHGRTHFRLVKAFCPRKKPELFRPARASAASSKNGE